MKKKITIVVMAIIILLLLGICGYFAWKYYLLNKPSGQPTFIFDDSAQKGDLTGNDQELIDRLNAMVEENSFRVSIAPVINVDSKTLAGDAKIINSEANHFYMKVELQEGDDVIYESKLIKTGDAIKTIILKHSLSPGEHDVNAIFHAIDKTTGEQVGGPVTLQIKVNIK